MLFTFKLPKLTIAPLGALTIDHVPTPLVTTLALKAWLFTQVGAEGVVITEGVGGTSLVMVTELMLGGQLPFVIVHVKVETPKGKFVTSVLN